MKTRYNSCHGNVLIASAQRASVSQLILAAVQQVVEFRRLGVGGHVVKHGAVHLLVCQFAHFILVESKNEQNDVRYLDRMRHRAKSNSHQVGVVDDAKHDDGHAHD